MLAAPHWTGTQEGIDPHSFDNGLGSDPLQTIRELRMNSKMLKNTWQTVLGYYRLTKRNYFLETCLRDLQTALDGVSDEQFLQCRRLLLKEVRNIVEKGAGPSRKQVRQAVVRRTIEEAARTWPRIALLLRQKEGLPWD